MKQEGGETTLMRTITMKEQRYTLPVNTQEQNK